MKFLSLITQTDRELFDDIQIETPFLTKEYIHEKTGIVDIKLILKTGEKINVEMQNYWSPYFPKRSLYYWAKIYAEDFTQGENYDQLPRCISVNLLNDRFPLTEKTHSIYHIMETVDHTLLDDALEMHFFNLSKAREDETLGELKQWLVFIQTDDRKERAIMANGNPTLEKANEVMESFYSDPQARKQYEAALKHERDRRLFEIEFERRGMERGLEKGMEKGRNDAERAIAKNLLNLNIPMEDIVSATGLSEEIILNL